MAERFYVNSALTPGELVLQGPEAHHLANVMRAKSGDSVILFDGQGHEAPATIVSVAKRFVVLSVSETASPRRELSIHLEIATAMPKGDRADFLVEKLTELGVARLIPLKTQRSVAHPKYDRLERSVIEACKQCGRNRLMEVEEVTEWRKFVAESNSNAMRLVAHPETDLLAGRAGDGLSLARPANGSIIIAIGPEGGFTDEEIAIAVQVGWKTMSLGSMVLRIETAAIAAAAYFALGSAKMA